jgi:hypothetical protein
MLHIGMIFFVAKKKTTKTKDGFGDCSLAIDVWFPTGPDCTKLYAHTYKE